MPAKQLEKACEFNGTLFKYVVWDFGQAIFQLTITGDDSQHQAHEILIGPALADFLSCNPTWHILSMTKLCTAAPSILFTAR